MNAPKEIWRAVVGFEGWYEVSSLGRVRRLRVSAHGGSKACPGLILKPFVMPIVPYHKYILGKGTRKSRKTIHAHVLVMAAFIGPRPNKMVISHKNCDGSDNRLENLEYATHGQNEQNSNACMKKGADLHYKAKFTNAQVLSIRKLIADGERTIKDLSNEYKVHEDTTRAIIHRRTWKYI